jgi:hypothetical protein
MANPSSWLSTLDSDPMPWFGFLRASGMIDGAQQQLDIEDRPGVDGFLVWLRGLRGDPFGMQTESDFESRSDALIAYTAACAAVGSKLVLYRYGSSLGQVVCLKCSLMTIQPASGAVNGMLIPSGGNGVVMTLNWTLRGVS